MYRVILVDVDTWALQSMEDSFPWQDHNMDVIGSYNKTSVALEAILRDKPDVVFSAIRMPVVSGIELMRSLRDRQLDTEIVIVSSSDHFEHAREALRLGAFDYCLKPVSRIDTDGLLSRLEEKLDRKAKIRNNYILELLSQGFVLSENTPSLTALPGEHAGYQIIWLCCGNAAQEPVEHFLHRTQAQYIAFTMGKNRCYLVNTDRDLYHSLCLDPSVASITEDTIGLSSVKGPQEIMALISEATTASRMPYITGHGGLYRYHSPHYAQLIPAVKRAALLLNEGSVAKFHVTVDRIPEYALENSLTVEDLCFFWNQLILTSKKAVIGPERTLELLCSDWREMLEKFPAMEDYMSGVRGLFLPDRDSHPDSAADSSSTQKDSTFGKMLQHLNANYTRQIKLKDLAEIYHINKNYASLLFKKHTNMSYSDYLNSLRLNHAKELLVSTSMSIAEVAENSGYSDYFYFSKLFKKTFGITPAQYRKDPL